MKNIRQVAKEHNINIKGKLERKKNECDCEVYRFNNGEVWVGWDEMTFGVTEDDGSSWIGTFSRR